MKLISKSEFEKYIIEGKDKGFSIFKSKDEDYLVTVYHREYEGNIVSLVEMPWPKDEESDPEEEVFVYYILEGSETYVKNNN